jgi:flavin reductase (DIM6/NTAB) family NADH-FMN oxidoreductase RutF
MTNTLSAAQPANFDSRYFRSALGRFATGVTVVTTHDAAGHPLGLTISSFNSVSLEPPMSLWSLAKKASSLEAFRSASRYVVHVLSASQLHLAKRFAYGSQAERFAGVPTCTTASGTLMLNAPDVTAWFECFNLAQHQAGDHWVFIGQVERCHREFHQPLVYHAGDFDLTPSTEPLVGR